VLSLVPCATPQHLRPTCHLLWYTIIWWIMYLWTLRRVGTTPVDWLIQPEIELPTVTSHPGPKGTSSPPRGGVSYKIPGYMMMSRPGPIQPLGLQWIRSGFHPKSTGSFEESNLTPFGVRTVLNH